MAKYEVKYIGSLIIEAVSAQVAIDLAATQVAALGANNHGFTATEYVEPPAAPEEAA